MTKRHYQAVIFDMDGVIADSEPAFFEAVNVVLLPTGKQIDWERYQRLLGTSISTTWQGVVDMLDLQLDPKDFVEPYQHALIEVLQRPRPLLPGVATLLKKLATMGTPIGLATSSRQAWAEALLGAVGMPLETFGAVVWREMAAKGKPAPDLYLKAAELLAVAPEHCIAIEDTLPGIGAAKAAGMFAIQVRSASSALPPIDDADLVLDSLEDFPLAMLGAAQA